MPKRTNEFQELIATIYKQIVPDGGNVTESGMVLDKDAQILREVDILVEYRYAHHNFKLVIECRDRSRKESVGWIDEIIGKIGSLKADKVVAVSKNGFAKAAIRKAAAHGIDALTTKEASEKDWDKYPIKPGLLVYSDDNYQLLDVLYNNDDKYLSLSELGLEKIVLKDGAELGTVKEVFGCIFVKVVVPQVNERISKEFLKIFKTKDDLTKSLCQEIDYTFNGFALRVSANHIVDISRVRLVIISNRRVEEVSQTHMTFNNLMISSGIYNDIDGAQTHFNIIQDPEANKIHCVWKRKGSPDEKRY